MITHISYETAKRLKEFLGKKHPRPLTGKYWTEYATGEIGELTIYAVTDTVPTCSCDIPQYQLHDLLSKPFCEAMAKYTEQKDSRLDASYNSQCIWMAYWNGGLPAVEKALIEMMEGV